MPMPGGRQRFGPFPERPFCDGHGLFPEAGQGRGSEAIPGRFFVCRLRWCRFRAGHAGREWLALKAGNGFRNRGRRFSGAASDAFGRREGRNRHGHAVRGSGDSAGATPV